MTYKNLVLLLVVCSDSKPALIVDACTKICKPAFHSHIFLSLKNSSFSTTYSEDCNIVPLHFLSFPLKLYTNYEDLPETTQLNVWSIMTLFLKRKGYDSCHICPYIHTDIALLCVSLHHVVDQATEPMSIILNTLIYNRPMYFLE